MGLAATTELNALRSEADSLRWQYDSACASASRLNAEWLQTTDHAARLWNRRQAVLTDIRRLEALAGSHANSEALAAHRKTA